MDIGKEREIVRRINLPVPVRIPETPEPIPAEPAAEPEPVPAVVPEPVPAEPTRREREAIPVRIP